MLVLLKKSNLCYLSAMLNGCDSKAREFSVEDLLRRKDASIAALQAQVSLLSEQLAWLQKQQFGRRSERIVGDADSQTLTLDFGDPVVAPPQEATEEIHYQRRKPVKNRGADTLCYPDNLPVKRVELDVAPEEKVCPQTGEPLVRIGEEISRKLARKAEQFYIIEYVRPKYVSRKNPDLGVRTAVLPDALIERCPADESLLAYLLNAKF